MARSTGGGFGTIAMIAAFLAVGGFLYWLSLASEPSEFAVADEGEAVLALSLTAFGMDPAGYEETLVELEGVEVAEILGLHAFFFELPSGEPYLARLPDALVNQGLQVLPGDVGRVTGRVEMMTDSILDAWEAMAIFAEEEHREAASAVTSYLSVESMQVEEPADDQPADDEAPGDDQAADAVPDQG
jgi:translation initiation factor IF-1